MALDIIGPNFLLRLTQLLLISSLTWAALQLAQIILFQKPIYIHFSNMKFLPPMQPLQILANLMGFILLGEWGDGEGHEISQSIFSI